MRYAWYSHKISMQAKSAYFQRREFPDLCLHNILDLWEDQTDNSWTTYFGVTLQFWKYKPIWWLPEDNNYERKIF